MSSRWNILWAAPWGMLSFLVVELLVFTPLFIVGLVLMPALLRWAPFVETYSWIGSGSTILAFKWRWADELFGNHEDGLLPAWWANLGGSAGEWFLRNPISNMRFWPVVSTRPKPTVRWCGTATEVGASGWFLAWQGPYVGFRWQGPSWGLWLGWKLNPRDASEIPTDYRTHGLGTACQVLHNPTS